MPSYSDYAPGPTLYWPGGTSARFRLAIRQCRTCPALDLTDCEVVFLVKRNATTPDDSAIITKSLSGGGIVAADLALGLVDVIIDDGDTSPSDGYNDWVYVTRVTLDDGSVLQPFGLSGAARLDAIAPAVDDILAADSTTGTIAPVALTPAPLPAYATVAYVDAEIYSVEAALAAHIADTDAAHAASAIVNTPAGNITAATVQAAIDELDTDKANLVGGKLDPSEFPAGILADLSASYSASVNTANLQAALAVGGTIYLPPGIISLNAECVIKPRTTLIFDPATILQRSSVSTFSLLRNESATSTDNTIDEDITIIGNGARIAVNSDSGSTASVPGTRGHLTFYNVRRLKISSLRGTDLGASNFFLHIANFENIEIAWCYVTGAGSAKDGIHLNGGVDYWIHDCRLRTYDDPLALNAWDYADLAPRIQPLRRGLIERCTFDDPGTRTGFTARLLPGAWLAWSATTYVLADTVNSGGYQYRKTNSGSVLASVAPTHTSTGATVTGADGIAWRCCGLCDFTAAPITDLIFRDCKFITPRPIQYAINADAFGNSLFAGTGTGPFVDRIVIDTPRLEYSTAETNSVVVAQCNSGTTEFIRPTLESGKLPLSLMDTSFNTGVHERVILTQPRVETWRDSGAAVNGLIITGGASNTGTVGEIEVVDARITGKNNGASFQSPDGIICYLNGTNNATRITIRGGRFDWLTSLVRCSNTATLDIDISGARFEKVRRLFIAASAGTGTTALKIRGNHFAQAPTSGLFGSTFATQTITATLSNNTGTPGTVVSDTTGASRVTFSDAVCVTASLAGAATGDLVRVSTGWQEYNGSTWGAIRN